MKFFTADQHWNHKGIITAGMRPFKNVWSMNQHMINCWNEVVGKGDLVYHLGDIAMPNKGDGMEFEDIITKLNGNIFWILGNHDDKNMEAGYHTLFVKVCHLHYIKLDVNKQKVMLCHYPMLTWRASIHGSWMLHGHCHGNLPKLPGFRLDVGVDTNNFYPYSENDVMEAMKTKEIDLIDKKDKGSLFKLC